MPIRFKCRHCKKGLRVPDSQAGRKNICPACRKPIVIPRPKPSAAEVENLAAALLSDNGEKKEEPKAPVGAPIKFMCEFCTEDVEVPASAAGTKMPCPECRRIIRVPVPNETKPKDWRDVAKKGPIGARENQPEELKDAWGTEQARRVTNQALQEADALPTKAEPVNLALWLKRGFLTTMTIGFVYLVYSGMARSRSEQREKMAAEEAVKLAGQLGGDWAAEIHRGAGELYCAKRKPVPARQQFRTALASMQSTQKTGVDVDLFLIDLALCQVELGGVEGSDEVLSRERFPWPEVQREVSQTLDSVSMEARGMAIRQLGSRFAQKKQAQLAVGIAGSAPAQQLGLSLAHKAFLEKAQGDPDKEVSDRAKRELAQVDKTEKQDKRLALPGAGEPIDPITRIAHVEGLAHQGKYKEALDLAVSRREPENPEELLHCLEACVGAAELALANKSLPEAGQFARKALEALKEYQQQQQQTAVRDWLIFELILAGTQADVAEVQDLAKSLPPPFHFQIRLAVFRQKLSKSTNPITTGDDLGLASKEQREMLSWPLLWESLARHNALRRSSQGDVLAMSRFAEDERVRAFLLIGFALGQHDANQ